MGSVINLILLISCLATFAENVTICALLSAGKNIDDCAESRCSRHGPAIRFPFWLKGHQPEHCGYPYPGFGLSCTKNDDTVMELQFPPLKPSHSNKSETSTSLPFSMKVSVEDIDYPSQSVTITNKDGRCHAEAEVSELNLSASPFYFANPLQELYLSEYPTYPPNPQNFSLFSCSSRKTSGLCRIPCLSKSTYEVYAVENVYLLGELPLSSCTKMFEISPLSFLLFGVITRQPLIWCKRNCRYCEAEGKYCGLKNSSKTHDDDNIECVDKASYPGGDPSRMLRGGGERASCSGSCIGLVLGPSLAAFIAIGVYQVYRSKAGKREDQLKIERFLEDYRALKPTRYSYADIKKITGNFSEKLGQGGYGTVYKGKLSNEVFVAVKVLNNAKGDGEEFLNEVGTIGRIHHVNVVRLVGYCADGFRRVLVYDFLPNNSLEKFLSSPENKRKNLLSWERLQQIAVGIAKGVDYLHRGCDRRILHFDIKPHNILLDHNYIPKVCDFGLAKLCSKEKSVVSMTAARGTIGYIAPEVFSRNFGNVSCKSDIYSFGMLLLEMVGGRKGMIDAAAEDESQAYFPEWMYKKLDRGEEITIQIENEDDSKIARKLAILGLSCIQWCPADRPSMKSVIQMLEADGDPPMPQNPFGYKSKTENRTAMQGSFFSSELGSIAELE